jgi:hypothetical protein
MSSVRRVLSRLSDPSAISLAVMSAGLVALFGFAVAAVVVGAVSFVASEVAG